jgi:23S rRNA (guanosine2251-2'-O)-methyltransferase
MVVYGRNAVREALRGPRAVRHVWASRSTASELWLAAPTVPVSVTSGEDIERRCGATAHQGVCAAVEDFTYASADDLLELPDPTIVVLDQIQDPQNLGAICRTAECAGASGVVIPERRAAEVTPAVCKASAGAVEHLPVARVRNIADFLAAAKASGLWCYGADPGGQIGYGEVELSGGVVLVLGSEGRGLRPRVSASCDALLSIPLRGRIESLSVSAAAAILLYAAAMPGPRA